MESGPMIDLHSHTTSSDGQYSPTELVSLAHRAGVTHLAVTDHDTLAGLAEATNAARSIGLALIPGIEISAFIEEKEVHILGHFISEANPGLAQLIAAARIERRARMEQMIGKLNALGLPVTLEQVLTSSSSGSVAASRKPSTVFWGRVDRPSSTAFAWPAKRRSTRSGKRAARPPWPTRRRQG